MWLTYGLDRGITKRPVMVLPYGGTFRSCVVYILDTLRERGNYPAAPETLGVEGRWLAKVVWEAIGEVVVAPQLTMAWLKTIATITNRGNKPVRWTAPSGFPVVQGYPLVKATRVKTLLFGVRIDPVLSVEVPDTLDKTAQTNGLTPNFIHSMDGAALSGAVNLAAERGVGSFAMIHDSFGTHAADAAILAEALRDAFVDMYISNDVLANFRDSALTPDEAKDVPPPPFVGGLDLEGVRSSPYFFS